MPPAHRLRAALPEGQGQPKARLTLQDVADALGVSRTTVSNAYNRPTHLSEVLRESIFAKARELGYFGPDPTARALRRRELQTVGVVFHHDISYALGDPTTIACLGGIARELDRRQLWMQVIPKMGRKLMLTAAFQSTADAIIVHSEIGPEFVHEVTATPKPLVLIDSLVPGVPSVRTDDRRGAMLAMQHALAASPDVVVVLSFGINQTDRARILSKAAPPRSGYVGNERLAGYSLAARAAGYPPEQIVWLYVDDQTPDAAGHCLAENRDRIPAKSRFAVVAMSDRMALSAKREIGTWRGRQLAALVGFDDIPEAAAAGLTTIRQDSGLKGELAVKILLDGHKSTTLPVELVVRAT
jgi:DNA-binding LacI/PurR family transcriptional regulator